MCFSTPAAPSLSACCKHSCFQLLFLKSAWALLGRRSGHRHPPHSPALCPLRGPCRISLCSAPTHPPTHEGPLTCVPTCLPRLCPVIPQGPGGPDPESGAQPRKPLWRAVDEEGQGLEEALGSSFLALVPCSMDQGRVLPGQPGPKVHVTIWATPPSTAVSGPPLPWRGWASEMGPLRHTHI